MRTLLISFDSQTLTRQSRAAVTAAAQLGHPVDLLVAGTGIGAVAKAAGRLAGVEKVLVADQPVLADRLAEPMAALIASLAADYSAVLAVADTVGKDVLPRAAALAGASQVSDIIEITDATTFVRPIYAGNGLQTVRVRGPKLFATVRATAFAPAGDGGAAERVDLASALAPPLARFVAAQPSGGAFPDLASARIVVAGGRSAGSEAQFMALLEPLAKKLGAALGATRSAVDAGYAPNDWQVGQTGRIVAPDLYIAIGISGAVQHLAGMKGSRTILAINTDPEAPIFNIADFGLVADMFEAVPKMVEAL